MSELVVPTTPEQRATHPDDAWVHDVCRIGQGPATCRYLLMGDDWSCGKLNPDTRAHIDRAVETGAYAAQADNCEGRAFR